jgi:acetyl-CoA carboxylase carboxyl transferase subunit alpha
MLEHSVYSVISPEGAASILWRDTTRSKEAATNMKITAQDLLDLKIIDGIIPEPIGGAQRAPEVVVNATGDLIARTLSEFAQSNADFREHRREKYLTMGRSL